MLGRIAAIALNSYREAVRARILYGLFALAFATTAYSVVVANMSLTEEKRVIADLGAASISLYAVFVAIVLGATSLHRELELKTIFPILTRQLRRHEYLIGKYLGTLAVLFVFIATDGAAVLGVLAVQAKVNPTLVIGAAAGLLAGFAVILFRVKRGRVFIALPWSAVAFVVMALVCAPAESERRLVIASAVLTFAEASIVTAVATFFASFSSPFLTAIFTLGIFLVGRSADTLANLPAHLFGSTVRSIGMVLAKIVPNLHAYVPPRPLLLGEVADKPIWEFVSSASLNALFYAVILLTLSALIFRKRDFL